MVTGSLVLALRRIERMDRVRTPDGDGVPGDFTGGPPPRVWVWLDSGEVRAFHPYQLGPVEEPGEETE